VSLLAKSVAVSSVSSSTVEVRNGAVAGEASGGVAPSTSRQGVAWQKRVIDDRPSRSSEQAAKYVLDVVSP
jgi:hypothetical protein